MTLNKDHGQMPKAGKILLYGYIGDSGWWTGQDNTDIRFQREFQSLENDPEVDTINVHINSPGGYVHDGMAIANIIERSEKPVNIYIDGIAYSMAAIIALHGDKVFIPSNGLFMLHNVAGGVWGNAKDLRSSADTMDKYDHSLASSIAKKTGLKVDQVKNQYLDYEDHFFTAEEALEANLVDEIENREGDIPEEANDTTNYNLTKLAASFGQMLHNRANESPGFMTMIKNQFSRFENKLENLFGSQTSPTPPTQEPSNSHTPMKIKATWLALLAFFSLTDSAKDKEVVEHTPSDEDLENL
ncbi:MAG: Clp protease ClpP, partial [Bacteroidota bacterium]|nr:Clp protease ClpP [Bacteroidota bacterium]